MEHEKSKLNLYNYIKIPFKVSYAVILNYLRITKIKNNRNIWEKEKVKKELANTIHVSCRIKTKRPD